MSERMLFVLGADDPEMRAIESLLAWNQRKIQYAMKDGKRVHPGNAYQSDSIEIPEEIKQIILIECQPASIPKGMTVMRMDHHRPGDPGYGLPPEQFWQASSIGQLCDFLGISMYVGSQENLVLAAMDHCPAAAIQGRCPGVSAQEVVERKIREIASATKHSSEEVQSRIAFFAGKIETAPQVILGEYGLLEEYALQDLRNEYLGEGYSLDLLCAQVAALAGGYTVLLRHRDAPGEPEKWSISGHAPPTLIEIFIKEWAPYQGLEGIYGVPSRGYAGGYTKEVWG